MKKISTIVKAGMIILAVCLVILAILTMVDLYSYKKTDDVVVNRAFKEVESKDSYNPWKKISTDYFDKNTGKKSEYNQNQQNVERMMKVLSDVHEKNPNMILSLDYIPSKTEDVCELEEGMTYEKAVEMLSQLPKSIRTDELYNTVFMMELRMTEKDLKILNEIFGQFGYNSISQSLVEDYDNHILEDGLYFAGSEKNSIVFSFEYAFLYKQDSPFKIGDVLSESEYKLSQVRANSFMREYDLEPNSKQEDRCCKSIRLFVADQNLIQIHLDITKLKEQKNTYVFDQSEYESMIHLLEKMTADQEKTKSFLKEIKLGNESGCIAGLTYEMKEVRNDYYATTYQLIIQKKE